MAIWSVIEVFKNESLVDRVRAELESVNFQSICQGLEKLYSLPLLQSIYSETVRLHSETQSVFYNDKEDIHINQWRFPKGSLLLVPNSPFLRDETLWNTRGAEFPADTFWADRFLAYPGDPFSGPVARERRISTRHRCKESRALAKQDSSPRVWPTFTYRSVSASEYAPDNSLPSG